MTVKFHPVAIVEYFRNLSEIGFSDIEGIMEILAIQNNFALHSRQLRKKSLQE